MQDTGLYTDGELAQLCLAVYKDSSNDQPPTGWTQFYEYEDKTQDFYAACYFKNTDAEGFPSCVALAYRGTVITSVPNLLGDLELALGKIPQQAFVIGDFLKNLQIELYAKLDLNNPDRAKKFVQIPWVLTGHSLGACLAEYSLMIGLIFGGNAVAYQANVVTFENPGSLLFIEKGLGPNNQQFLDYIRSKCRTIQTDVNIINTCNPQVGQVFTLVNYPYNFNILSIPTLSLISSDYIKNPNYLFYSFDLHKIAQIADHMYTKKITALQPVKNYPSGFAGGYKCYLNPERFVYWNLYTEEIWNTNPAVHAVYKDLEDYYASFISSLKKIYNEAPSMVDASEKLEVKPCLTVEQKGLLEWKLRKAEQIAHGFERNSWTTWNGQAKAEMIFGSVNAIREALKSGQCDDKTPEEIFNQIKSLQGKTLNEAMAWQRFWSFTSDEGREPPSSLKEFKILNPAFK